MDEEIWCHEMNELKSFKMNESYIETYIIRPGCETEFMRVVLRN